jgi:hypothetical protein
MPADTGKPCPGRRSNHGQRILITIWANSELGSDLDFCVELWGFEPQTSCMPWNTGPFTGVRDGSPATRLIWAFVPERPLPFTGVHRGR